MSHIEILLPFGLPPNDNGHALLSRLQMPALASLVSRSQKRAPFPAFSPLAKLLPHEAWLAQRFGLTHALSETNSPPLSTTAMHRHGIKAEAGYWFLLNPVHFQLGYDHLTMSDKRGLQLSETVSPALFEAARTPFEETGKTLIYGDARTWFLRADDWQGLITATPDMACGRHLANWMPEGDAALAWRKCLNEVQMIWHTHLVNRERQVQHLPQVNALWLWGGALASRPASSEQTPYSIGYGFAGDMEAYASFFPEHHAAYSLEEILATPPRHAFLLLDDLIDASLNANWQAWKARYEHLEASCFAVLENAMKRKSIDRVTLHASNDTQIKTYQADSGSLRKFWIRKTLTHLLQ